jgi:hypothetical protein
LYLHRQTLDELFHVDFPLNLRSAAQIIHLVADLGKVEKGATESHEKFIAVIFQAEIGGVIERLLNRSANALLDARRVDAQTPLNILFSYQSVKFAHFSGTPRAGRFIQKSHAHIRDILAAAFPQYTQFRQNAPELFTLHFFFRLHGTARAGPLHLAYRYAQGLQNGTHIHTLPRLPDHGNHFDHVDGLVDERIHSGLVGFAHHILIGHLREHYEARFRAIAFYVPYHRDAVHAGKQQIHKGHGGGKGRNFHHGCNAVLRLANDIAQIVVDKGSSPTFF